jgi:hypothetical protein
MKTPQLASSPIFVRVWLGQAINVTGDAIFGVALALWLLERADSARALGLALGSLSVGTVVTLLFGGVLADRYRRSVIIIAADLIRMASLAALLLATAHAPLWAICGVAFVLGTGTGLYRPAYSALLPSLVSADLIPSANAVRSITNRVATVLGAAIAGILVSVTSPGTTLWIDVASFAFSAMTLVRVADSRPHNDAEQRTGMLAEAAAGARYVLSHRWMTAVMLQGAIYTLLVVGPISVILPLLVGQRYPQWLGYITAAQAIGAVIGASLGAAIHTTRPGIIAMLALLAELPEIAALALGAHPAIILILALPAGLGLSVFAILWTSALQTGVPRAYLGRVLSIDALANTGIAPVGPVLTGFLVVPAGSTPIMWTTAGVLLVSVIACLVVPQVGTFGSKRVVAQTRP